MPVRINPLPSISYVGTLSAGYPIVFTDDSYDIYITGTFSSATWDFGDGYTSSTTSGSIIHSYAANGNYTISLSAYDISANVGVTTTNLPMFASDFSLTKSAYITLCGPKEFRYGSSRDIDLVGYLPDYLKGSDTEDFLQLFENFLNEMYPGLDGFTQDDIEQSISAGYELFPKTSASDSNFPRENTYTLSGETAETDANDVDETQITYPANSLDENTKISILEKIDRIADLHDPDLIDIEYIQFFAKNLGYDINISRDKVGISGTGQLGTGFDEDSPCISADNERYLRFVVRNLPTWYKIKSTRNAIKIMLYSFGLVGDIVEYYTDSYLPQDEGGKWRLDYEREFTDIPDGWYPTPHFSVNINIDDSANISFDVDRRESIIHAIESVRPINTVFKKLSAYVARRHDIYVGSMMRMRRYIKIESDGWANNWSGSPPTWTPDPL